MKFRYGGREFDIEGVGSDDHIFRMIRTSRAFYELPLLEYTRFVTQLERAPGCIAIDVGANIGNHSIYFGAVLGAHTLSIEPNPRVLPILRRNLQKNLAEHAVYECAVGAEAGRGRVVLPSSATRNVGMAKVEAASRLDTEEGVLITTLDAVVDDYRQSRGLGGRVLLVKIDVEGGELGVLRGAAGTLREHRPHVLVEAATPLHRSQLADHLSSMGYELLTEWGWRATPVLHFSHRPPRWARAVARAYQVGTRPRDVARALRRRWRALSLG